jgi:hypothetical protein
MEQKVSEKLFMKLVQEFKIKIWTSIKSYGKRWGNYRRNEASKPVPLKFYLEAACSNKMRDFIKYINRENYKISIDEINYDFGIEISSNVTPSKNKFIVNGVDLLEGLSGKEKIIFSLFLRGYNNSFLSKVYFNNDKEKKARKEILNTGDKPFGVADIIELQKSYLIQKYGNELMQQRRVFSSYSLEDE